MAVDYSAFIAEFEEYRAIDPELVAAKLREAKCLHSETAWGPLYDLAVKYTAADLLAMTPAGFNMAIKNDSGQTIYSETFKKWVRARNIRRGAVL